MKVIAGEYKGRKLNTLQGDRTRPTSAVTKEALFQMLGPFFPEGIVIDLYAGSGSLGIEAISRGMDEVYFVENNHDAIKVIQSNIDLLTHQNKFHILDMPVAHALIHLADLGIHADLILMDPPYHQNVDDDLLKISELGLIRQNGVLSVETHKDQKLADEYGALSKILSKNYGSSQIFLYRMNGDLPITNENDQGDYYE